MGSSVQGRKVRSVVTRSNIDNLKTPSRTDQLVNTQAVHTVMRDQLVPQLAQMNSNAVNSDRRDIFFYRKKTVGRTCSCVNENGQAEGQCQICFKTGIVGGFDKFGTHTEVFDITANFSSINIIGEFTKRPNVLCLCEGSTYGEMVFDFEVKHNRSVVDLMKFVDYIFVMICS